jgi:hypothetical protein
LYEGRPVIDWLTSVLFNDQCGPAAVNWWGWLLLGGFFGGGGLLLGALLTSPGLFGDWH